MHWNLVQGSRLAHVSDILVECSCKRDLIPVFLPLRSMALQMMHCLMRECPHKWWFGARNYCLGQLTWANSLESVFTNKFLVIPNRASCVWFFFFNCCSSCFLFAVSFPLLFKHTYTLSHLGLTCHFRVCSVSFPMSFPVYIFFLSDR